MNAQPTTKRTRRGAPPALAARLVRGEATLAEFAGLGREELYAIARVGYQLLNGGRLEDARAVYRGLAAADPFDSVFRCHLAAAHLRLGEAEEAVKEFTAALRLNVANVDALSGRGEAHLTRGRVAEAVTDLTQALRLDPEAKRPSTLRARALLVALKEAADKSSRQ
ncbi:MAG TPA: tetratricopeptide repeat protein [Pyrinomonadaceae bacterium]|nr:tetratricopeptide repeat protein [Pyrinomonadaceae bacterium]